MLRSVHGLTEHTELLTELTPPPPPPQPLISFPSKKDHLEFFNLLSFRNGMIFMKFSRAGVLFLVTVRENGGGKGGGVGEGWRIGKQSISKVHPSNCPPTPPLTQQQSIDNKLGLMLVHGRGKWAVAQILILIPSFYIMLTTTDLPPLPLKTTRSLLKRKQTNKKPARSFM